MPLDHDDRCNAQDRELTLLKEQHRSLEGWMSQVTERVQTLVTEMHEQNVKQGVMQNDLTHIKGKVDEIEDTLKTEVASKSIVEGMRRWYGIVGTALIVSVVGVIVTWLLRGGLTQVVKP